ncbi:LCP family protein required for cell wall assembly [Geomicrobium halophilum]|uniref:LCP family protein required for cell wall assembly n=1 Tax=Geomicrobium halophilum TaxID=549000 RepID=A0A841PVL7_9BACL|nr:LCP family protein [Geomicrobium halophilum]MBB6450381.1 LCP family protein required for cell wall assembly [Geomicrobium halophilum]
MSRKEPTRSIRLQRHKRRRKRIFYTLGALGVFIIAAAGALLFFFISQANNLVEETQDPLDRGEFSERRDVAVDPSEDNISVLFLGTDDREGDLNGLSDAILLATFNRQEDSVKVVSIPRDSYVQIPGRQSEDKINHAHAIGGADLAVETVEDFLDIPVDYYVTLNFDAFMEVTDAFGGVDVNSPFAFYEQDSEGNPDSIFINEGEQTLNGEEALAYVRMRKQDPMGDLGRGERQQEVFESLIDEATSLSSITSYNEVFNRLQENMNMNISFNEITSLHSYAGSVNDIELYQLEGDSINKNGIDYFQVTDTSLANTRATLKNHLELDEGADPEESGETITAGEDTQDE